MKVIMKKAIMKKNETKKSFLDIMLEYVPSLIYLGVVVPLLMVFSINFFSDTIGTWTYSAYHIMMILIMIALNLLAIASLFYVTNIFMKTDMKRLAILGLFITIVMVSICIYKGVVYGAVDPEVDSNLWELTRNEFVNFRAYTIVFVSYYIISMFVDRIAVLSLKNKGRKTSK